MMSTPDGHGRLELTRFGTPPAVATAPEAAPPNTFGLRRVMFEVEDLEDTIARLRTHGGDVVGEIARYEDVYRLCYFRGPEGILVGLAQMITGQPLDG
jgi:predicted enzyme related to lactoylglutathione lyase